MRRIPIRTCLLVLSTILIMVTATSCAPDHVHLRVGVGIGGSPFFHHPGFLYRPYWFDDPYRYDPFWGAPFPYDPWGFYADPWLYNWGW